MRNLAASFGIGLCAIASPASGATVAYTDPAAFAAALGGATLTIEGYETGALDQLIPSGSGYNGVTYSFGGGRTGQIDNDYARFGDQSLEALANQGGQDFFLPGDTITVTFNSSMRAVGGWFNVAASPIEALFLSAAGGSAAGGGPADSPDFGTLYFLGIISDTPFTQASFGSVAGVASGFNLDNLTSAAIPEPGIWASLILGFGAIGAATRRRAARSAALTA